MKKIIPMLAAITFLTATPTDAATRFADVAQYDTATQQAVTYLADKHIIKGTTETTFTPKREIKRGQVVKMLGRYLETTGKQVPTNWETVARFDDVPITTADRELLQYAALVYDEGVFVGSNGKLHATNTLSRENLVLVLSRLTEEYHLDQYAVEHGLTSNVLDLQYVKEEAKEAVQLFNALGISNVDVFNPKGRVQRIHFASFLAKLLQLIERLEEEQSIIVPKPTPPTEEKPLQPTPELPPIEPIVPPTDEELEGEDAYIVEDGYIEQAEVIATTATTITVKHASFGTATFKVDEVFSELFAAQPMWQQAQATLYIEEDVVTEVASITVRNPGTSTKPITVDGSLLDGVTQFRITSSYAELLNFDSYYELVDIDVPTAATYTISGGEFEQIRANGALTIMFTGVITNDVVLDAPTVNATIANTSEIFSIAPTHAFTVTVEDGGTLYDLYASAHITEATIHGYIDTLTVNTTKPFTLYGTGEVNTLYGEAANVIVQENGVTVLDLLLSNDVDEVIVR